MKNGITALICTATLFFTACSDSQSEKIAQSGCEALKASNIDAFSALIAEDDRKAHADRLEKLKLVFQDQKFQAQFANLACQEVVKTTEISENLISYAFKLDASSKMNIKVINQNGQWYITR